MRCYCDREIVDPAGRSTTAQAAKALVLLYVLQQGLPLQAPSQPTCQVRVWQGTTVPMSILSVPCQTQTQSPKTRFQ